MINNLDTNLNIHYKCTPTKDKKLNKSDSVDSKDKKDNSDENKEKLMEAISKNEV